VESINVRASTRQFDWQLGTHSSPWRRRRPGCGASAVVAATVADALPEVDGRQSDAAARPAVVNARVVATRRLASAGATPNEALHVVTNARLRAGFLLATSREVLSRSAAVDPVVVFDLVRTARQGVVDQLTLALVFVTPFSQTDALQTFAGDPCVTEPDAQ